MNARRLAHSVTLALLATAALVHAGVSDPIKKAVKERYRESDLKNWGEMAGGVKKYGAVLVALKPLPARADRASGIVKVMDPVRIDIENGKAIATGDASTKLLPGTLLVVVGTKFDDGYIELTCRTVDPANQVQRIADVQNTFERVGTRFRFIFDQAALEGNEPSPIFKAIDQWVKIFAGIEEAQAFAKALQ